MADYDYIVVGAGSSGAVVAERLSQNPSKSVLLLEAGPNYTSSETPDAISYPNFWHAMAKEGYNWSGLMATLAEGKEPTFYFRGFGVGGSSAINGMMALRGTPEDYNRWSQEYGCVGWAWEDMLAAFLAVEDDIQYGGDGLHGRGGRMPIDRVDFDDLTPYHKSMWAAAESLGYPVIHKDYHAEGATGMSLGGQTMRDGRRFSTNDAYLEPARSRENLTIKGGVQVSRVALEGNRAVGVVTSQGDFISADEVILSAGAIHSPTILLRSGIGPETGLPVGKNLMEHPAAPIFLNFNEAGRASRPDVPAAQSILRYSSGMYESGSNDMQFLINGPFGTTDEKLYRGIILVSVLRNYSRGEVRLNTTDVDGHPELNFEVFSDERDLVRLRDGVRRAMEFLRTPDMQRITESAWAGTRPIEELSSDDAIDEWLWSEVADYFHASGTCRMGAANDPLAVVDPSGKVIGYEGLRVADASIMPDIPRANTHLTCVAIGYKIAEMIVNP